MICGVDTGGTFTDCILVAPERMVSAKVPSTPGDMSIGFFEAVARAAAELGLGLESLMPQLEHLIYGTTVATNIAVQRNGARAGLLATRGFGDTLLMMRAIGRVMGLSPDQLMHLSATSKPDPLIPRALTREVVERIDWRGEAVVDLDEAQCSEAISSLLEQEVESIAIAFLWSFVNPAHEHRGRELVHHLSPSTYVTCSADVAPKWGEYERTATAAINAYVGPATERYMGGIAKRAARSGAPRAPLVLQCGGGAIPIDQAGRDAVRTIGSGPTAGVMACLHLGLQLGHRNIICADVGGTTFDVGLVRDGLPVTSATSIVAQYKYYVPTVDVQSIGAGGGSIAWIDASSHTLRVGPESAGALPGPACYGRGGTRPTVTDAAAALGYLSPDYFLGGRITLDREAAMKAIGTVAQPLGLSIEDAAGGILRIAEFNMADLVRKVTIQRGYDPRDFVLFAYGGAGPVHAGVFGAELGVQRIIIPLGDNSSLWSAYGAAASDLVEVFERSELLELPCSPEQVQRPLEGLLRAGNDWLETQGIAPSHRSFRRYADMRYKAQVNEVEVEIDAESLDDDGLERLIDAFEAKYAALYGAGAGYRQAGVELTALRVEAVGALPKPEVPRRSPSVRPPRPCSERTVYWATHGGTQPTAIYRGGDLRAGDCVTGPAILEFPDTTLVVGPDYAAVGDEMGNIELLGRSG